MLSIVKINDNLKERKKGIAAERRETAILLTLLVFFVALTLLRIFVFSSIIVSGESMCDTLQSGDIILINKLKKPSRGDIIVFAAAKENEEGKLEYQTDSSGKQIYYIKRLIGEPLNTVYWTNECVVVEYSAPDGRHVIYLDEPYIKEPMAGEENKLGYFVPEGKLFVMGDNRNVSSDSRGSRIGLVNESQVLGVVTEFSLAHKGEKFWTFICKIF